MEVLLTMHRLPDGNKRAKRIGDSSAKVTQEQDAEPLMKTETGLWRKLVRSLFAFALLILLLNTGLAIGVISHSPIALSPAQCEEVKASPDFAPKAIAHVVSESTFPTNGSIRRLYFAALYYHLRLFWGGSSTSDALQCADSL